MNVSSDAAFVGVIDRAAYCASKGSLDAISRVMANELGAHRIRVNCVNPNITLTDMARKARSGPPPRLSRLPLGRAGALPAEGLFELDRPESLAPQ